MYLLWTVTGSATVMWADNAKQASSATAVILVLSSFEEHTLKHECCYMVHVMTNKILTRAWYDAPCFMNTFHKRNVGGIVPLRADK